MKTTLTMTLTFDLDIDTEELHQTANQIFKDLEREYQIYDFCLRAEVTKTEEVANG